MSTHWDREWYQSFQDYRYRLVGLFDHILDGWQDGRLAGPFFSDGQAIMVEDYLEVRPERRAEVGARLAEGKLSIGPWYTLPDEFLVSGESLIRNLLFGRKVARELGGTPSDAGFLCDMFGQNSQMPQIFAKCGVRGGFIWRGTNVIDRRLLWWRGADGTMLPCLRFGREGYCDYAVEVRLAGKKALPFDPAACAERLDAFIDAEAAKTQSDAVLLFDGGDHMEWDEEAYAVLAARMDRIDDSYQIVHSSLDAFLDEMLPQFDRVTACLEGELAEPAFHPEALDKGGFAQGTMASRPWIKQENAACQTLLCQWAEPFSAWAAALLGREVPQGFLDLSWKWLLMNHAHDSIASCSIDAVHEDMKYRFRQSRQIADRLAAEAERALIAAVEGEVAPGQLRVGLFNPLAVPFDGTAELTLELPDSWSTPGQPDRPERKAAFHIVDAEGKPLPYQRLGQSLGRTRFRVYRAGFPRRYRVNEARVSLPLSIPALGYTTLTVCADPVEAPTRLPRLPGLATSERSMANEYLEVTVEPNGTLTLLDKRTGRVYYRLLTFEDRGDIGDGYGRQGPVGDEIFVSSACSSSVALVQDGPYLTTFRIRTIMETPEAFDYQTMQRSERWARLEIDTLVSLRPAADRVEVSTTVRNVAKDHRLRVLFPTGARTAATYLADSPFDVIERRIGLRPDAHLYRQEEIATKPQQSWSAVFDRDGGLAVVGAGLMETEAIDLPERPLALTLFRATRRTVFTDGEPGGQVQGDLSFRYWLVPLEGAPDRAELCRLGQLIQAGLRDVQLAPEDFLPSGHPAAALPREAGWLELDGPVVLTSLRANGGRVEVRIFNPKTQPAAARVRLNRACGAESFGESQEVDCEGRPLGERTPIRDGMAWVELGPKEFVTLALS